ncbi:M23 family metallopeptidase [Terricaulis sp.]|uniref:M23 family metallopeptidase n=1 Tax=Terricaulis sp. TaxID=2768686 RepID=UPI003783E1AB
MKVPFYFVIALAIVALGNFALLPRPAHVAPAATERPVLPHGATVTRASGAPTQQQGRWGLIGPSSPTRASASLLVPVEGVSRAELVDTWGQARSEGRTHQGIDILAPEMTPVHAVADGRIVRFFESARGGVTIYQFDASERYVFYYAHLNSRARGLAEGSPVRQGDLIGYVGMTGNAPVPHLHFEIERLTDEKHWWEADAVNPFPFLRDGVAPG